jgi:hypothetical protein
MATQRSGRDADEEASCGDNNNWRLSLAMGVGCICAILLFSDGFSWSENLVVDVDALDVGASEPTAPWFDATPDDTPNAFAAAAAVGVVERKAGVSAAALDPATSLDGGVRGVTEVDEVLSALDGEGGGEKQGDATYQAYLDRTAAAAAAVPKGGSGGGGNATGRSAVVLAAYKEDYAWGGGAVQVGNPAQAERLAAAAAVVGDEGSDAAGAVASAAALVAVGATAVAAGAPVGGPGTVAGTDGRGGDTTGGSAATRRVVGQPRRSRSRGKLGEAEYW